MQSLKEQLQHGGGVSLSFSGNFYNGYFDTAKTKFNTLGIKWRYREAGSSTWSAWTSLVLNTGFKYGTGNTYFSGNGTSSQGISLGTGFNYKKNYVFELCYNDKLSSVTYSQTVKEGEPCFDYGKDKDGNNYLNVNGKIYSNNDVISKIEVKSNTEIATNEYVDGKRVYTKQIEFTDVLNAGQSITKSLNLPEASRIWIDTANSYFINLSGGRTVPIPCTCYEGNFNDRVGIQISWGAIVLYADTGWNENWTKVIRLKYIK
jgi:hypothetical protein